MPSLTQRDEQANDVLHLLSLSNPRTDCPTTLNDPIPDPQSPCATASMVDRPLPTSGNATGFLSAAYKADLKMAGNDAGVVADIQTRFKSIATTAQAHAYVEDVLTRTHRLQPID